ncbi:MAG TPA: L-dopachrome tautomerase-related protein [Chryseolinea sp.]
MSLRTIILSWLLSLPSVTIAQDYQHFFNEGKKAFAEKRYPGFYAQMKKAHELHPYHQTILWYAGVAAALTDHPDEAITFLTKAININTGYNLNDSSLNALRTRPAFQTLIQTQAKLSKPMVRSDTAYIFQDRQLHLEAVAFDPVEKTLYGGSIHKRKIVKIDSRGVVSDFTGPAQYGMGSVFGVRVDAVKRILWACSSSIPEMQDYDSALASKVFEFDIQSGRLIRAYSPNDTIKNHVFGDLVLDSKGAPYISDSRNNIIYRVDAKSRKLVPYFSFTEFWSLQGLAFSEGDRKLYISDYVKGIFVLDTQTMELAKVSVPYDLSLKGTDGILFYDNSLITIQNGVQPNRVVRHFLNTSGDGFMRYEFIDNAHPAFGEPTIGTLAKDTLMYVANSQWNGYLNGTIKPENQLQPTVVLQSTLK